MTDPIVTRDIKRVQNAVGPSVGTTSLPSGMMERLLLSGSVPIHFSEPDPRTHRENYYYNSRTNRLYVRLSTTPVPVWRSIGG